MPQIFEFHFNPAQKGKSASVSNNFVFDTYCFEPSNVYEKRMGNLYLVGLLKNFLPQNAGFLDALAKKIKEKYYQSISSSPEKSLKEALKFANEYLEKIAKQGDVSWLGNLNFSAISIKNFELDFTKVGNLKIFLIRKGQLIDVDQKLKFDEIEPYPLKIFGNIVSGKLAEDDIILILSQEIYQAFLRENLLDKIAETKKFKNVLNGKKEELAKISGICLVISLSKEEAVKEKEMITEKKTLKIFSFKEAFKPLVKKVKLPKISLKLKKPSLPSLRLPKIKIPFPKISLGKKAIFMLVLISLLILGFLIFEKREAKEIKNYQSQINQIQEKIDQAESNLSLADYNPYARENARMLYKEVWDQTSLLLNDSFKTPSVVASRFSAFKNTAWENLCQLDKLTTVIEPELVFEFKAKEFIPRRLTILQDKIYFSSPNSEEIIGVNLQTKEKNSYSAPFKINLAYPLSDSIVFLSKPNKIIFFKENSFQEPITLQEPYADFDFIDLSYYRTGLYFLDSKNKEIVRYPSVSNSVWPELWLPAETKLKENSKSMAVDGSIWVLNQESAIERYYLSRLEETITPDIFPYPENFSRIYTNLQLDFLYILEPGQKRVIVLDKSGKITKQFQSQKFDNLLDLAVSQDGKTIYLLNNLKVYRLEL